MHIIKFYFFHYIELLERSIIKYKTNIKHKKIFFRKSFIRFHSYLWYHKKCKKSLKQFLSKNVKENKFYEFQFKLIRLIITILIQLYAIIYERWFCCSWPFLQPTENFIGLIPMLCNGDDSYPTIIHNLSRYEFVNRSSKAW